jgi:hypothetical protein
MQTAGYRRRTLVSGLAWGDLVRVRPGLAADLLAEIPSGFACPVTSRTAIVLASRTSAGQNTSYLRTLGAGGANDPPR